MDRNSNMSSGEKLGASESTTQGLALSLWSCEILLGVSLVAFGIAKQSPFRALVAVAGLASGVAGIIRWRRSVTVAPSQQLVVPAEPTTTQSDYEELDLVDEASWESFPSSDPPAFTH